MKTMFTCIRRGSGRPLSSQTKAVVMNVSSYLKKQIDNNPHDLRNLPQEVAIAVGLSVQSVKRVMAEYEDLLRKSVRMPSNSKKRKWIRNKKIPLSDFDKTAIRQCIVYDFHKIDTENLNVRKIREKLQETIQFQGNDQSLRRIIRSLGFRWCKLKNNRRILVEKHSNCFQRISYLRKMAFYRAEGRRIVFTDETHLHSTYSAPQSWSHNSNRRFSEAACSGQSLNIIVAAGAKGFTRKTLLVYKANQPFGEYHRHHYEKWLTDSLIPIVKRRSVIVLDKATNHNQVLFREPTKCSKKNFMINWLQLKGITVSKKMLKPKIYEIVMENKTGLKDYAIDHVLGYCGFTVVHLPPNHADLNPINKFWPTIKGHVTNSNLLLNMHDIKEMVDESICQISHREWHRVCRNCQRSEEEYKLNEVIIDKTMDQIITLGQGSESESDSEDLCAFSMDSFV